jgi:hypothetical protein
MAATGFPPAPYVNLDEFERRLREGGQRTGSNDAPSELPRKTETSSALPQPASRWASNTVERARTAKESPEPLDVRSSPHLRVTPGNGTSRMDSEDSRALDVDDFRRWWQQSLTQEEAQNRPRGRNLTCMASALAGIALISSALALKGGGPTRLITPPVTAPANEIARAQNLSGETAGKPSGISAMPPAGLSGTTAVAPEIDPQAIAGLASRSSAQTTDHESTRRVPVRPEGTPTASQVFSSAERRSAANTPKPPAKPASERRMTGAIGTTQPSIDLPAQRRGKITAHAVVGKTEAAIPSATVDTPSPPLPIGTPVRSEGEASRAKALQPITESVAAPATPAKASPNPLLRALGDLFGAPALPARQSIDPAPIGSTGWAIQLGAPRSEVEAKRDLKRLHTRYGSALRGSTVGLRKLLVNGETEVTPL